MSLPAGAEQREQPGNVQAAKPAADEVPLRLRLASVILRSLFCVLLLVVILHVAMPQSETLATIFDTPGDVVRLVLGLLAAGWIGAQLFATPTDLHAHKTWIRLGLIAIPFMVICIIATW